MVVRVVSQYVAVAQFALCVWGFFVGGLLGIGRPPQLRMPASSRRSHM